MYCLSQFCCLYNKIKLKLLQKITCNDLTFLDVAKNVIPEIQLFGIGHVLLICDGCVKNVTEMHTFRQTCIWNNDLMARYIGQLSSTGGEIGTARVEIFDIETSTDKQTGDTNVINEMQTGCDELISADGIKAEAEESPEEDPLQGLGENYDYDCNETGVRKFESDVEANREFISADVDDTTVNNSVPERPYKCETCGKFFQTTNVLKLHAAIHTDNKPYKCEYCPKSFRKLSTLKTHRMLHTGERPNRCETCGKSFTQKGQLRSHILTHTGEKVHKCDLCGKSFTHKSILVKHFRLHTGEKPFKCDCGKSFPCSSNLTRHKKSHNEERHVCEICQRSFRRLNNLKQHRLTHTDDNPCRCEICGSVFNKPYDLKVHKVVHNEEKPFKCEMCGKLFAFVTSLKRHGLTHSGEKPYKCDMCGKCFSRTEYLNKHRLTHVKEEPNR